MRLQTLQLCLVLSAMAGLLVLGMRQYADAYDSQVDSSLRRSKNALLTQKDELLNARDKKKAQINQLQQDLDRLDAYIRDTDRTLRDIDIAMSRNN